MFQTQLQTPVGTLIIIQTGSAITGLSWATCPDERATDSTPLLQEARRQLTAYFNNDLVKFDVPLQVSGSRTLQNVCAQMAQIPFGETRSYAQIGASLALPAQAIGQACGRNPIPIFIPCHRVLGSQGLGGFSGGQGIETKVALLRHEGAAGLLI